MDWRNWLFGSSTKDSKSTPQPPKGPAAGSFRTERERQANDQAAAAVAKYAPHLAHADRAPKMSVPSDKEKAATAARSAARPDTSERAVRQTALRDRQLRRELTTDEWGQLSTDQQAAVRFNTDLLAARDADEADGLGGERRNTKGLVSQLGVGSELEERIAKQLGLGVGPAVRYDDLFSAQGAKQTPSTTPSMYGGPAAGVVAQPTTERQRLVNSLSATLGGYLQASDAKRQEVALAEGLAKKDTYNFDNPQAKADFEASFDFLLDKVALGTVRWSDAQKDLASAGYNPDDFKNYARDRIQLLPVSIDRTSLQELDSWFSS